NLSSWCTFYSGCTFSLYSTIWCFNRCISFNCRCSRTPFYSSGSFLINYRGSSCCGSRVGLYSSLRCCTSYRTTSLSYIIIPSLDSSVSLYRTVIPSLNSTSACLCIGASSPYIINYFTVISCSYTSVVSIHSSSWIITFIMIGFTYCSVRSSVIASIRPVVCVPNRCIIHSVGSVVNYTVAGCRP